MTQYDDIRQINGEIIIDICHTVNAITHINGYFFADNITHLIFGKKRDEMPAITLKVIITLKKYNIFCDNSTMKHIIAHA